MQLGSRIELHVGRAVLVGLGNVLREVHTVAEGGAGVAAAVPLVQTVVEHGEENDRARAVQEECLVDGRKEREDLGRGRCQRWQTCGAWGVVCALHANKGLSERRPRRCSPFWIAPLLASMPISSTTPSRAVSYLRLAQIYYFEIILK